MRPPRATTPTSAVSRMSRLPTLPPLPLPRPLRRHQRLRSVVIVFGAAIIGVGLLHLLAGFGSYSTADMIFVTLAWTHTTVAIIGLIIIQFTDPGIVRRSEVTCLPVPKAVSMRIDAGESLTGLGNLTDGELNRSYCVRCCVWRPPKAHHCSICQRCVKAHDHHCAIFGQCVGGSTAQLRGNLLVFKINIGNLLMTPVTAGAALVALVCQEIGAWGTLLVLWPVCAISLGCLRRNGGAIKDLFLGHRRGARRALTAAATTTQDTTDGEVVAMHELNDAACMALEQQSEARTTDRSVQGLTPGPRPEADAPDGETEQCRLGR